MARARVGARAGAGAVRSTMLFSRRSDRRLTLTLALALTLTMLFSRRSDLRLLR